MVRLPNRQGERDLHTENGGVRRRSGQEEVSASPILARSARQSLEGHQAVRGGRGFGQSGTRSPRHLCRCSGSRRGGSHLRRRISKINRQMGIRDALSRRHDLGELLRISSARRGNGLRRDWLLTED